ncbi:MAG: BNR repeat-containing protein [Muribaculum sp.]|nr:BNR repeat-containing protein [Muribaculum sp.]
MKYLIRCLCGILVLVASTELYANSTIVHGGAWCWFADPRAVHHKNELLGIDKTYIGCIDNLGNIKAEEFDFNTGRKMEVLIRSYFQPDDHNNPTFLCLPDGRVIVFYSRHTDEPCFYYRITDTSGSLATLSEEKVLSTKNNTTYPSPFYMLDDPGHIYLCWRGINWHPTIGRLTFPDANGDMNFDVEPSQIVQSTGARPYAKYDSNGKDKIFLTYTTGHPDVELPNHLYYNVISVADGTLSDINGKVLGNVWGNNPVHVNKSESFVHGHQGMIVDAPDSIRDWVWQLAHDKDNRPSIAMVEISPDKSKHAYYVARYDGRKWVKTLIDSAGGWFHQSPEIERCYSGGMAIDPEDVNRVYCSVPRQGRYGEVYEIVEYMIDHNGRVVSTKNVTSNSAKNNVRPYVVASSLGSPLRLGWMYGNYYDWIVSSHRPSAFDTDIVSDFGGLDSIDLSLPVSDKWDVVSDNGYMWEVEITPDDLKSDIYSVNLGDVTYSIDTETFFPVISYGGNEWKGLNRVATAEQWRKSSRATDGKWYNPVPYDRVVVKLILKDGVVQTFVNGMLDQTVVIK